MRWVEGAGAAARQQHCRSQAVPEQTVSASCWDGQGGLADKILCQSADPALAAHCLTHSTAQELEPQAAPQVTC